MGVCYSYSTGVSKGIYSSNTITVVVYSMTMDNIVVVDRDITWVVNLGGECCAYVYDATNEMGLLWGEQGLNSTPLIV